MEKLRTLFSDYRAEWSSDLFDSFFVAPPYFAELEVSNSCKLMGGRGTGKTTALQSLRFDVAMPRLGLSDPSKMPYYGIYIRINKNRVPVFDGPELPDNEWDRLFCHYMNLLVCLELCELSKWLRSHSALDAAFSTATVGLSLGGDEDVSDENLLEDFIVKSLIRTENYVNNPSDRERVFCSIPESPVRHFAETIAANVGSRRSLIFCCIDEYENLTDRQQALINTYIKHAAPPLSYKFGVRQHGHRTHRTRNQNDLLNTPDDYREIDVANTGFEDFAKNVATRRLTVACDGGLNVPRTLSEFVQSLSLEEEAELLGAKKHAARVRKHLEPSKELAAWLRERTDVELCFLAYWHEKSGQGLDELASAWNENPAEWKTRIGNHLYASIFWITKGWKGKRLHKYYAGPKTFLGMASGNIRYFLELLDESVTVQLEAGPFPGYLEPKHQTAAAKKVGARRLKQLGGLTENGIEIKRIVLGIGRVFFERARSPLKRAPEVNQFLVTGSAEDVERVRKVLVEGVAHLAFESLKPTKATSVDEKQDAEYRLHPIYSAYFEYAHRSKRSAKFPAKSILKFENNPRQAMRELLGADFITVDFEDLPEQIAIFSNFYEGGE